MVLFILYFFVYFVVEFGFVSIRVIVFYWGYIVGVRIVGIRSIFISIIVKLLCFVVIIRRIDIECDGIYKE